MITSASSKKTQRLKNPKEVFAEWAAAFNRRDAAAAAALYHDDATNIQVALGEPVQGRKALRDSFAEFFRAFPDSYTQVEHLFEDGEWAIIEWTGGGTFLGEFAGHHPERSPIHIVGMRLLSHRGRQDPFQRGYWDKATWFKQLGIPIE